MSVKKPPSSKNFKKEQLKQKNRQFLPRTY